MAFEVSFEGIKDSATFLLSGITRGTDEGKVVKLSAAKTVSLCAAENKFFGVIKTIEPGNQIGGVEEAGYQRVPYSGAAPSVGQEVELVANGTGGVKTPATSGTGLLYRVVEVDTSTGTLVLKLRG
ncbi:MAG TPA: hypothetical protein PK573_07730 [Spirochaetota bacterium]|nr:hypothetical protein [Spirochaetota bacterium]HRZ28887.1 hypothetical protein [Spirochaetota bacterium]HSA15837.1 hypothetical protein [Spirochaetota bacterium]